MKKFPFLFICLGAWAAGCVTYESGGQACSTLADCNPGKDCGLLVECIDGKCDAKSTIELPCQQSCQSDSDCPEEMHCRFSDQLGTCVADGTCADVSECQDLPHDSCLGEFECTNGVCRYVCLEITDCVSDSDCTLVWQGCCGASGLDSYTSIRADAVKDWQGRPECLGVLCEPCMYCPFDRPAVCWGGECIESFCDTGSKHCVLRQTDPFGCAADSDCTKAKIDCCGCEEGGPEGALNTRFVQAFADDLVFRCATAGACYPAYMCTDRKVACLEGRCGISDESCGCPFLWDPVCAYATNQPSQTYANECLATCEGRVWFYHGACECQADCDCDICGCAVCASNNQTYYCGQTEAECNGLDVLYRGECSADCEWCLMLGRPSIPACDENFCDQDDFCFAECHGLDWWHTGACLAGEGSMCGGIGGIECPTNDLYCLITDNYPDAAGRCIKQGACLEDAHCTYQTVPGCPAGAKKACRDRICACD